MADEVHLSKSCLFDGAVSDLLLFIATDTSPQTSVLVWYASKSCYTEKQSCHVSANDDINSDLQEEFRHFISCCEKNATNQS